MAAAGSLTGGRPTKPAQDRYSEVLNVRVTPSVADAVCRAALRTGLSVTEYVRRLITRGVSVSNNGGDRETALSSVRT